MTPRATRLHALLTTAFTPARLEVVDDSAKHAGHAGAAVGGETHYSVLIVSDRFEGQGRVARHRLVHAVLDPEFEEGLHALALTLRAPSELSSATAASAPSTD